MQQATNLVRKINNILFLIIGILLNILLFSISVNAGDLIQNNTINNKTIIKLPPTMDEIRENPKLMPITQINGTIGEVIALDRKLMIDKIIATKDEQISLSIDSDKSINEVCFELPVKPYLVDIKEIYIDKVFWFNEDIKSRQRIEKNKICFDALNFNSDEIKFKAEYKGKGIIKYNITVDGLILDPYLIGDLSLSPATMIRIPFDNNISNVYSVNTQTLNASNTRMQATSEVFSASGDCVDSAKLHDASYLTYGDATRTAGDYNPKNCYSLYSYNKNSTETGALWQIKYNDAGAITTNISIPISCFNNGNYPSTIELQIVQFYEYSYMEASYYYCDAGLNNWQLLYTGTEGNAARVFENSMFFTNESSYQSYSYPDVRTQYYYLKGLTWINAFSYWPNSNTKALRNDILRSATATEFNSPTYSSAGITLNGVNQYITIP